MRVLVISKIFPNAIEPLSSPFNRQQIAALARRCSVHVVAPIPWLPLPPASLPWVGPWGDRLRAGRLSRLPQTTEIDGLPVDHPRAPYVPRVGTALAYPLLRQALFRWLARARKEHPRAWDVVLGTWIYPDACAAIDIAGALGVPCVVKAHGSDLNVLAERALVRRILERTLPRAAAALAPSKPLVDKLIALGAPARATYYVPNGVDANVFRVRDRAEARRALGLGLEARLVVFVGRLDPRKGVRELCEAHAELVRPSRTPRAAGAADPSTGDGRQSPPLLAFVGAGPLAGELEQRAARAQGLLLLPGARPATDVALWIAAADVVALPSYAEGMPNALLEALASGRPVVATRVGGIPDVVVEGETGLLVPPGDPAALRSALEQALARAWDPSDIARSGPASWDESAAALERILERAVMSRRAPLRPAYEAYRPLHRGRTRGGRQTTP